MSDWQIVKYKHRGPKLPTGPALQTYLQQNLKTYANGRFPTVEAAQMSLALNMMGGLPETYMSFYERALVAAMKTN